MDPKNLSSLDPKLREAYERVMGTTPSQPSEAPHPEPSVSTPSVKPSTPASLEPQALNTQLVPEPNPAQALNEPMLPPMPSIEPEATQPPASSQDPIFSQPVGEQPNQAPPPLPAYQPQTQADISPSATSSVAFNAHKSPAGTKGKLKLSPVIIGVGVVVLLLVYTFVWVKLFNLKLPFLP